MIFRDLYAEAYDGIYADKDYVGEVNTIERVYKQYCTRPLESVLDMGCGAGGHSFIFSERGYNVVGFDQSHDMINLAKAKFILRERRPHFEVGDVRTFRSKKKVELAVMLFGVFSHQESNDDALSAIRYMVGRAMEAVQEGKRNVQKKDETNN